MTDPRDIEQPEPRRADSRGLPLAERPRVPLTEDEWIDARRKLGKLIERMEADAPEAREAEPTSPLTLADALEVELADGWHDARAIPRLPRSERRG